MAWWDDSDEDFFGDFSFGGGDSSPSFDWDSVDFGAGDFDFSPVDLGSLDNFGFDLSNIDFSDLSFGDFDFGDLADFGADVGLDLSNIGFSDIDFGNVDFGLPSLENIGFGAEDFGSVDFGGLGFSEDVKADISEGLFGGDAESQEGGFYGNIPGAYHDPRTNVTTLYDEYGGDAESQEGGFYGNTPGAYYDPRTNLTTLYDESGQMRDFVTHEGEADIGGGAGADAEAQEGGFYGNTPNATYDPRTNITTIGGRYGGDAEAQEGGFYGNTPNATYDPRTNTTTIRDDNGNVTRTVYHGDTGIKTEDLKTTNKDDTKSIKDIINQLTGGKDNTAMMAALLGGLLGLLNRPKGTSGTGYKGGIPKYTSVRGKPGEGTRLIKAAGGGLMGLASGGAARPARYLRGGTDGMADKIQTNIDGKQPARLSHGEFVIPADVVSHLGNGNSDAGADVLYDMMAKVRKARTGTTKQGKQINPRKYTPA